MQTISEMKNILAQLVRKSAQEEILSRFQRVTLDVKRDGSIVTEADLVMQSRMKAVLRQQWPEIGLVGEEMTEQQQKQQFDDSRNGVWILDPLDGTSNYAQGIPFFSISIALIKNNDVQLGVVYDPARDELFSAIKGQGAYLNGQPLLVKAFPLPLKKGIGLIDFKRLDATLARKLAEQPPYGSQRSFGSVALDWCWIAAGRGQVYLHGKQKLWDFAAGWLILNEAGGYSCTLQGEPVFHGELQARSAVAAGDKNIFDQWCQWLCIEPK